MLQAVEANEADRRVALNVYLVRCVCITWLPEQPDLSDQILSKR